MLIEREKELVKLVKEDWEYFAALSKEDQTEAVIDAVLFSHPWCFRLIKSKKMKTYIRCYRAVEYDGSFLYYVPKKMQDISLVSMAVHKDDNAYVWIKNSSLKTFELSLRAVKRRSALISAVPKKLKKKVRDTLIAQEKKREKELKDIIRGYGVKI